MDVLPPINNLFIHLFIYLFMSTVPLMRIGDYLTFKFPSVCVPVYFTELTTGK